MISPEENPVNGSAAETRSRGEDAALLFDEAYYQNCLGPPYERNEYWLGFFSNIAEQITRSLNPHRVLDAGCAMGMLVEAFWDRGVEAWGIDLSRYAISRVRPDMRMCCREASLIEPIEGRYDLITCIEVLEHMHEDEVRTAVANLTRVTDRILFSSTPDDFGERTHFTVRPPIYWLKLFAEFGFWPDLEYDASYITQHAMLLCRRPDGLPLEALTLFARSVKFRTTVIQHANEITRLKSEMSSLSSRLQELSAERGRLEENLGRKTERLARIKKKLLQIQNERSNLQLNYSQLQDDMARLEASKERLEREKAEIRTGATAEDAARQELQRERGELAVTVQEITWERDQLQRELTNITSSPGWKIIFYYRRWLRRQMARRSWLVRIYEPLARWSLQRVARRFPEPAIEMPPGTFEGITPTVVHRESPTAAADITYEDWIQENEPSPQELQQQIESGRALSYRPLLSIVVPVYRVKRQYLEECIRSVLAQTYEDWELCIADGCPEAKDNRAFLTRIASEDSRVKLTLLDENRGISGNSNAALATATGEFVVLLDHDDVLPPFALYDVVKYLSADRNLDVIYSDHDYIDETSRRLEPLFKPDWSPELMLSANYITHLTVIRRGLFEQVGGFDTSVDSAQDWDFFFRVVRTTQRIAHIPKVLYHWRKHVSSTALNAVMHPSTIQAQLHSIQRHLKTLGWAAQPEMDKDYRVHIRWLEGRKGKISIIIPSKDKVEFLSRCIQTLFETTAGEDLEILIVDNGSTEAATIDYYRTLANDSRICVLSFNKLFNYSAMNNFGAAYASGDYLLFLNNDIEAINSEWLQELIGWIQVKEIGAVGAKLLRPDGTIQHAGAVVGFGGFAGHPFADAAENNSGIFGSTDWYRNYLAVTGACMAMRREVFEEIGGFDESFISCGSDVEICLRLRAAGYRIVYNPFARLLHHECATRKGAVPEQDFFTSFRHYREFLAHGDPYWNPNLSPWKSSPALRGRREQTPLEFAEGVLEQLRTAQSSPSERETVRAQSEEALFVKWFDFSEEDVRRSKQACTEVGGYRAVRKLVWFIPDFQNPYYGGICTILRFADYLRRHKKVSSYYVVWGSADLRQILRRIRVIDPGCSSSELAKFDAHEPLQIPEADACVATLWATAYPALKYQGAKRKFYFIQDYEPLFYRAGSGSAMAESTYRFGFYGIANTISLKQSYEMDSGQKTIHFSPCVDTDVFFPATPEMQQQKLVRPYRQLFCYARPNHPRNAFELVAAALQTVKKRLGDRVRIVCAGDEWQPKDYGLSSVVENLGILDYRQTAQLYRESDCGIALMFTRHPSYIPFELMACGALVIANQNRWTEWLLKDGENCLLSEASATCLADTIVRGLENNDERTRITVKAQAMIRDHYSDWGAQICRVYDFMCDPERILD